MGLFNLPAPLYAAIDHAVAMALPAGWRLAFWAAFGAIASLLLYKWLSPQEEIAATKKTVEETRRRLLDHTGDLASALPLIRVQFATALRHLVLVFPATLIASVPVVTLVIWLDTTYARILSPDGTPPIDVVPHGFEGTWQATGDTPPRIKVRETGGNFVADIPVQAPIPMIEKRRWWNLVIGNPAGYLPAQGPLERVTVHLPERTYLPFGPGWARSWLAVFGPIFFVTSLGFHRIARIQ